ncbi:DNA-directed RNA polymerase subunit alpha [Anaplasmataceae bacterium AB001_6]|nr:DNA-directed RNA polymerase subunit alpha [Anaplasmataceae bacterium AB001_6]
MSKDFGDVVLVENWSSLIVPSSMKVENVSGRRSVIIFEPLESGFGITLGNSLRRVMLSSLQGAAVTMIKIKGVLHQFSKFPGVSEDVNDIIQNLKNLSFSVKSSASKKEVLRLFSNIPGPVTGSNVQSGDVFEVINKEDSYICFLNDGFICDIELTVEVNRGYIPAIKKRDIHATFDNVIPVDSSHSPVVKVSFDVQNSRVGNVTDYDKLVMDVETDGSISPDKAVSLSAKILQEQFRPFINFEESSISDDDKLGIEVVDFDPIMFCRIDDLDLSVRSFNCLKTAGIVYVGDLMSHSEQELMKMPNFGKKSLNEIKDALLEKSLILGKKITNWRPKNIEEYVKKYYEDK